MHETTAPPAGGHIWGGAHTFVLELLHHLRHQLLVEGLPPLDELDVQTVVNFLEL